MAVTVTWNVMTSGNLGEYITRMALRQYEANLVFAKLGKSVALPKGVNTYTFPTVDESVAMGTLTEGITPTEGSFSLTNISVNLTQYGWFVKLSDVLLTDAPVEVITEAAFEAGRQAALAVDNAIQGVLLSDVTAATQIQNIGGGAVTDIDAGDTITSAAIATSVNRLKGNDAPAYAGNYYVTVIHPHVFHDLQQESGTGTYIDVHKYDTPESLFAGEAWAMWWTRFLVSSNADIDVDGGTATTDVYATFTFGRDAYGVVTSGGLQTIVKGLGDGDDPLNQRSTVGAKVRLGTTVLRASWIQRINSASSLWANAS